MDAHDDLFFPKFRLFLYLLYVWYFIMYKEEYKAKYSSPIQNTSQKPKANKITVINQRIWQVPPKKCK
jgi:hypothetical protein